MYRRRSNRIWFVILGMFVAVFLFTFLVQRFTKNDEVDAANMSAFDPGYIISDYQMSNFNSMSESDIYSFLKSKGRCNNSNFSNVGKRVGYFSDSTPPTTWHVVDGHTVCLADENINGESAAHIIWQAAQDNRINPQVLIVLLQKETGLITDPIPNSWDYQRATGYGCPDTAACSSKYYGFKNQIRNAASLFRYTLDNGYSRYPIGGANVQWSPKGECGSGWVNIRNNATAALYRYTPYQPNFAALASSYGYGDECSSYGNRNFYSYFEDWFGGIKASEAVSQGRTIDDGVYQIISVADYDEAIDIEGGVVAGADSNNTDIYKRKKQDMDNQLFEIKYDTRNGYYSIINPVTGLALDVDGGSMSNNTQLLMWRQHDGCNQDWVIMPNGNEEYTIISRCSSKVLDATATNDLVMYERHGGKNQRWVLSKVAEGKGKTVEDGVYQFISVAKSDVSIDIEGGVYAGMNSGNAIVYIRKRHEMDNQLFEIKYNENSGYYNIINPTTGLALGMDEVSVKNNAKTNLLPQNNNCSQDWIINDAGRESYTIVSRCSSKVLDLTFANKLVLYDGHGGNNQRWTLGKIAEGKRKTINNGIYQISPKSSINKVVDIQGGVRASMMSGNAIIYNRKITNMDNQLFEIKYNENSGYYNIINPTTGLALDVSGARVENNTKVGLWEQNGDCNQEWEMVPNDNGYTIYSKCSSKVLDATFADELIIYSNHGGNNQRWTLTKVD